MSRLGVPENISELLIGHSPRGLIGIDDRAERWSERRNAFERVSAHIMCIIENKSAQISRT